jgi:3-oxoacyl-[acyl-carrier protein] reductase
MEVVAPGPPARSAAPLDGRVALVTGVSRAAGIGMAVARRLHDLGAIVEATGWPAHDAAMPWGEDPPGPTSGALPPTIRLARHDLEDPAVPAALIDEVADRHGRIDVVVAAHARSSHVGLPDVDAAELDRCWAVNARSVVLLAQQLGRRHQPPPAPRPPTGRLVWFTSGQHLAPMDDEIAYAVSKGALHQMTRSVDHALRARRVTVNCVNPGPVDTGYTAGELHDRVAARFPDGRWGHPDDIAAVVAFLVGDAGAWIRGQVLDVEGGFDRFAR